MIVFYKLIHGNSLTWHPAIISKVVFMVLLCLLHFNHHTMSLSAPFVCCLINTHFSEYLQREEDTACNYKRYREQAYGERDWHPEEIVLFYKLITEFKARVVF